MFLNCYFDQSGAGAAVAFGRTPQNETRAFYGLADIAAGIPITENTPFDLASVTKMFTAAAVLMLVDQNRLRLSDRVREHVNLGLRGTGRDSTIQDLLWHTSGIPDYVFALETEGFEDVEQICEWLSKSHLDFPPGTKHEYSNTNYALLAEVIGRVSGVTYQAFVETNMFAAFGMVDSFICASPHKLRARGYKNDSLGERNYSVSEFDIPIVGDGGAFVSLNDLSKWQDLFFNGRVLSRDMTRFASQRGHLDDGTLFGYGCGLLIETRANTTTWCGHTGGWIGTSTFVGRYLDDGAFVIVLSNEQNAPVIQIAAKYAEELRGGRENGRTMR